MRTVAQVELASTLRIAVLRLSRRLRAERTDDTLSASQLSALAALNQHGPLTLGDLAAHERVRPPSMTRIVGLLEERGLLVRVPDPTDRRQVLVEISASGKALLHADRRRRDAWLAVRLKGLSSEDRALLLAAAPIIERLAQE
jgi:DNA-binding MarR family transcriptional regulator